MPYLLSPNICVFIDDIGGGEGFETNNQIYGTIEKHLLQCFHIPAEQIERVLTVAEVVVQQGAEAECLLRAGMEFEEARGTGIRLHPWPEV